MSDAVREIGSAIAKLRTLVEQPRKDAEGISQVYKSLTATVEQFWDGEEFESIISSVNLWKEVVYLFATGRIVAIAAQAEDTLSASRSRLPSKTWICNGRSFAEWIAQGILQTLKSDLVLTRDGINKLYISRLADMCSKALSTGQTDALVERLIFFPLSLEDVAEPCIQILVQCLPKLQQQRILDSTLSILSSKYFFLRERQYSATRIPMERVRMIGGAASLIRWMVLDVHELEPHLFEWLSRAPNVSAELLRAAISVLESSRKIELLQKMLIIFNDKLFIRHASLVQQEGYVYRENPMELFVLARSSHHISGTSEHLASSSVRIRFLGMIYANTISGLVDKEGGKINFDLRELDQPDLVWYQSLVDVEDKPTSLQDLQKPVLVPAAITKGKAQVPPTRAHEAFQKVPTRLVEELVDDEEVEDDTLRPYSKPLSDREDSEDDATVVRWGKPKRPVYIRDLISGIGDSEDYDRHILALMAAPNLIRRKADFGSELKDRATELASLLVGLGDKFEAENFQSYRLQSMLALLVAQPAQIGPLFVSYAFSGDFSLEQRVTSLNALGIGAQELLGLIEDSSTEKDASKPLPERLHKMYTEALDLSRESLVAPRVRHLKESSTKDQRKVVTEDIYKPLLVNWQLASQRGIRPISRLLLPTFVKTLGVIFTACGPNNPLLPELTTETWELLLGNRAQALEDRAVLEALLYAILTLLSVNEDKRQVTIDHGKRLAETQQWVQMIYEQIIGGSETDEICKTLAEAILATIKDIFDTYQRLLIGTLTI